VGVTRGFAKLKLSGSDIKYGINREMVAEREKIKIQRVKSCNKKKG